VKTLFVFVGTVRDLRRLLGRGVTETTMPTASTAVTGSRTNRVSQIIRIRHANRRRAVMEEAEEAWGA